MRVFRDVRLSDFLEARLIDLRDEVEHAEKNYFLNANERQYLDYLVDRYRVEPLVIAFDKATISDAEKMIPGDRFPSDFFVESDEQYPKQVITYHVPFSGDPELLRCRPSSWIGWTETIGISNNAISFEVVNWRDDPEQIRSVADDV